MAVQEPHPDHGHPEHRGDGGVLMDRPGQGVRALEVQAVDDLAGETARMGPRRGGHGPGEDGEAAEGREAPHRPDADPVGGARALAGFEPGAPGQRKGHHEDEQGQAEVGHDEAGRQMVSTVKPPSTAWATTPSGSRTASHARSRRNGRRVKARMAAITVITPTTPEMARLPNSMRAWVLSGGKGFPPHLGQFAHPSPESVSRTAAPVMMISVSEASAT